MKKTICLLLIIFSSLVSKEISTFYGPIDVNEDILIELIESEAMQRLKKVHQYGVSYYTTHPEEYSRYDHSLGVFALLRKNNAPLKEQIAGLLHDVSHTVFSHVGDWIFGVEYKDKDYQNQIHSKFLEERGILKILKKYGYTAKEMDPNRANFPMLEDSLPNMCADRIEYNIQGAFHQGFLTHDEAIKLFNNFSYERGNWVADDVELVKKITRYSIFMSEDCWGSPINYIQSRHLADAIIHAKEKGIISNEEIHFGIDDDIWNKLQNHKDSKIQEKLRVVHNVNNYFSFVDPKDAEQAITTKCRGIDPLVKKNNKTLRLSEIDSNIANELQKSKKLHQNGWGLKKVNQLQKAS